MFPFCWTFPWNCFDKKSGGEKAKFDYINVPWRTRKDKKELVCEFKRYFYFLQL